MPFYHEKPSEIIIRIIKEICKKTADFERNESLKFKGIKTAEAVHEILETYAYNETYYGPSETPLCDMSMVRDFIKATKYWWYRLSEEVRDSLSEDVRDEDEYFLTDLFKKVSDDFFEFDINGFLFASFCTPFMGYTRNNEPQQITRIKVFQIYDVEGSNYMFEIQLICDDDDDDVLFSSSHGFNEGERKLFSSVEEFCDILEILYISD